MVLQVPQPVEGDQRGGAVGAAAGQPAGHRDALLDLDRRRDGRAPWCSASSPAGADDDVGLVERDAGARRRSPSGYDGDAPLVGVGDPHVVVQADRLVDGVERVEPVVARSARRSARRLTLAGARTALDAHAASASAIRTKSGEPQLLAAGHRVDAGGGERRARRPRPSRPARAAPGAAPCAGGRTPRRRPRTPAARVTVVVGGSRRVHATSPESTLGAGQKTLRPIAPARRTSANQAALTDGMP